MTYMSFGLVSIFDGDFRYMKINTIIYGCFEVTPDELIVIRIEKLSEIMIKDTESYSAWL